jgi:hypothetical protein
VTIDYNGNSDESVVARTVHDLTHKGHLCPVYSNGMPYCLLCTCSHRAGLHGSDQGCSQCNCQKFSWSGAFDNIFQRWTEDLDKDKAYAQVPR